MGCSQSKAKDAGSKAKDAGGKPHATPAKKYDARDLDSGSPSDGGITGVITSASGSGTGTRNTSKDDHDFVPESSHDRASRSGSISLHQIGLEISSSKALGAHNARSARMERLGLGHRDSTGSMMTAAESMGRSRRLSSSGYSSLSMEQ